MGHKCMEQKTYRIFIADDSIFIQNFIQTIFEKESCVEVVGTASDGVEAIEKIPQVQPDLLILDLEMPRKNGLEVLEYLMENYPLPVLILSAYSEAGADITFEALNRGAIDFIPKRNDQKQLDVFQIKTQLLEKVKSILQNINGEYIRHNNVPEQKYSDKPRLFEFKNTRNVEVIVVGSSTGGPGALEILLSALPVNLPVPVVVAQHMPEYFTHSLAKRLSRQCKLPVVEVVERVPLQNGIIYLGTGGKHIVLKRTPRGIWAMPIQNLKKNPYKPSVDMLFSSSAEIFGSKIVGVILTGMGKDGLTGAQRLKQRGGFLIAQDRHTSVVYGMPKVVTDAGLADLVLPINMIAPKIIELLR